MVLAQLGLQKSSTMVLAEEHYCVDFHVDAGLFLI